MSRVCFSVVAPCAYRPYSGLVRGSSWGDCRFSCLCKHKFKHQEINVGESNCEQEFKMLCWPLLMLGGVLEAMTEDIGVLLH